MPFRPISFGEVGSSFVLAFVAVDQQGTTFFDGTFSHFLVCLDTIGAYGNDTILASFCFAAADEVIFTAVDKRNCEQFSRPAAAGDQDQGNICSVEVRFFDSLNIFFRENLPGTLLLGKICFLA